MKSITEAEKMESITWDRTDGVNHWDWIDGVNHWDWIDRISHWGWKDGVNHWQWTEILPCKLAAEMKCTESEFAYTGTSQTPFTEVLLLKQSIRLIAWSSLYMEIAHSQYMEFPLDINRSESIHGVPFAYQSLRPNTWSSFCITVA